MFGISETMGNYTVYKPYHTETSNVLPPNYHLKKPRQSSIPMPEPENEDTFRRNSRESVEISDEMDNSSTGELKKIYNLFKSLTDKLLTENDKSSFTNQKFLENPEKNQNSIGLGYDFTGKSKGVNTRKPAEQDQTTLWGGKNQTQVENPEKNQDIKSLGIDFARMNHNISFENNEKEFDQTTLWGGANFKEIPPAVKTDMKSRFMPELKEDKSNPLNICRNLEDWCQTEYDQTEGFTELYSPQELRDRISVLRDINSHVSSKGSGSDKVKKSEPDWAGEDGGNYDLDLPLPVNQKVLNAYESSGRHIDEEEYLNAYYSSTLELVA